MDITTALTQFCEYATFMRGYSPHTVVGYRGNVGLFQRDQQIADVAACTAERVFAFLYRGRQERHWSARTFITYHKTLVVFFRFCVQRGYLDRNPAEGVELPRIEKRLPPKLTRQEALRLLETVHNYPYPYTFLRARNHAIFATFLYTGLRKSELLHLQCVDVDLDNLSLFVRQGKGSKDRVVPLTGTLAGILRTYLAERKRLRKTCPEFFTSLNRNGGFRDTGMKHLVTLARKASGIAFSVHKLRHTFATLMLEGGCDIFSLSRMLGHSDIKTTTIYLAASPEHLRAQMVKHPLNTF